jgi:hypothetical protein
VLYLTHSEGCRAGERNAANELQAMYEASGRRHREKLRRRRQAEEYERRAEALLLEEPDRGEGGRR